MDTQSFMRTALLLAVGGAGLLVAGCTAWRLGEARALARASEPFQQQPAAPVLHLLVVGDSTGVGTGASQPERSVAGLLGASHPRLAVHNRARDGARFVEVASQLAARPSDPAEGFDVILINAGGNDVIRGTDPEALKRALDSAFAAAHARLAPGGVALVQPPGMVGHAPFFLPPISALMNHRAAALHIEAKAAAARHGLRYIDMARPRDQDPFVQRPELNASDGLHPSDAGYRVWHDELLAQSDLVQRLATAGSPSATPAARRATNS
jgi:lysophospholipase L1-like esterase